MGGILVCLDGEPHTREALRWALARACSRGAVLTGLHIQDTYLKKFHNELYSQGRREFLEHVECCLVEHANAVLAEFNAACAEAGIEGRIKVRNGDPVEEIPAEVSAGAYEMVVFGGKRLGWFGRFRSRQLPLRLARRLSVPVTVIRRPIDDV